MRNFLNLLFATLFVQLHAQTGFNIQHVFPKPNDGPAGYFDVIASDDTLFMIAQSADTAIGLYGINFAIVDTNGNLIQQTFFTPPAQVGIDGIGVGSNLIRCNDGTFAVVAFHVGSPTKHLLVKFDASGNLINHHAFGDSSAQNLLFIACYKLIKFDKNLIGIGKKIVKLANGNHYSSLLIFKFNEDGDLIWQKEITLDDGVDLIYSTAAKYGQDQIAIATQAIKIGSFNQTISDKTYIYIVDTSGSVIRKQEIPLNKQEKINALHQSDDLIYGSILSLSPQTSKLNQRFVGFDTSFQMKWITTPDTNWVGRSENPLSLIDDTSGELIIATVKAKLVNPTDNPLVYGFEIYSVSKTGTLIWKRYVQPIHCPAIAQYEILTGKIFGMAQLASGSLVYCGNAMNNCLGYYTQRPWLVKLEGNACMNDTCATILTSQTSIVPLGISAFVVSPNPARDQITLELGSYIEASRIQVLTSTGVPIYNKVVAQGINPTFSVSNLSSGLYFVQVLSEKGQLLGVGKVVKE
jgi:Secretion system C-terminal sorting domain